MGEGFQMAQRQAWRERRSVGVGWGEWNQAAEQTQSFTGDL